MWKADVDSAFRRVPLRPKERWAAAVAFKHRGKVWVSQHNACPFGAAASVYAWQMLASVIYCIARVTLHMAVHCYVDDFFAPERCMLALFMNFHEWCMFFHG